MSPARPRAPAPHLVQAAIEAAIAAPPLMLKLQVNTASASAAGADGAGWRDVIDFPRDDDMACAYVLTAAPLLAAAAGPGATLRICSADGLQKPFSHWEAGQGWRGALPGVRA